MPRRVKGVDARVLIIQTLIAVSRKVVTTAPSAELAAIAQARSVKSVYGLA